MQAEGNARRTKDLEKRAYVVQMQNLVPPVRGPERHAEEALQADVRAQQRRSVVQLRHRLHQSLAAEFLATYGRAANPVREHHLRRRAVRLGRGRGRVFVRKDSTAPVVVIGEEVRAFANDGTPIPIDSCTLPSAPCSLVAGGAKSRVIIAPDPQAPVQALTRGESRRRFHDSAGAGPGQPDAGEQRHLSLSDHLVERRAERPELQQQPAEPDVDQPDVDQSHVDEPDVDQPDVDEPDVDQSRRGPVPPGRARRGPVRRGRARPGRARRGPAR